MFSFKSIENIPKDKRGYSVAIGNFDGMHLGHLSVIKIAKEKVNVTMIANWKTLRHLTIVRSISNSD